MNIITTIAGPGVALGEGGAVMKEEGEEHYPLRFFQLNDVQVGENALASRPDSTVMYWTRAWGDRARNA